jgi:hypothetical protein
MNKIFVDANIYLDFYNTKSRAVRKLLPALAALAPSIVVTQQVVSEVNRNKLEVAQRTLDELRRRMRTDFSLPDFVEELLQSEPEQKWTPPSNEQLKLIEHVISKIMTQIMQSGDLVSVQLEPIFALAVPPSQDILTAARVRRELGLPPGKAADPLGDQLNWEQLLSLLRGGDVLFMISRDTDYYVRDSGNLYLNPVLMADLTRKNLRPEDVRIFDNLADALRELRSRSEIPTGVALTNEILDQAAAEEKSDAVLTFPPPFRCWRCGRLGPFLGPSYIPSPSGERTLQYLCAQCGAEHDTGEQLG